MGCACSLPVAPFGAKRPDTTLLELRIQAALQDIIRLREAAKDGTDTSFTRIILKFPILRRAIASLRAVFERFDADNSGSIDTKELRSCMEALGAAITDNDIKQMFSYTNFSNKGTLTFKEFVLCLCLGSVLQLFPELHAYEGNEPTPRLSVAGSPARTTSDNKATNTASSPASAAVVPPVTQVAISSPSAVDTARDEELLHQGQRLVKALRIILEAYVLFDKDGSGTIDRQEVLAMIEEENKKSQGQVGKRRKEGGSGNVLLSKERWMELDYDDSGEISFAEFVHAFMDWVGIDDEEEEGDSRPSTADPSTKSTPRKVSAKVEDIATARMTDAEVDQALTLHTNRRPSTPSRVSMPGMSLPLHQLTSAIDHNATNSDVVLALQAEGSTPTPAPTVHTERKSRPSHTVSMRIDDQNEASRSHSESARPHADGAKLHGILKHADEQTTTTIPGALESPRP